MRAEHSMTRRVIVVPPHVSLRDAWDIMGFFKIRHLPVVQNGSLLGIVSDRDILLRAAPGGVEPKVPETQIGEAMSAAPYVCSPSTHVAEIVRTMTERKIDAMPVLDAQDKMVGLVTSTDLLLLLIEQDEARPLPFQWELEERLSAVA